MTKLIAGGLLAALFFSSTFVLNRAMSLGGGHWVWSASLRYLFMLGLLTGWLAATGQTRVLRASLAELRARWAVWLVAGSVGCGVFYAPVAYSASHAPGWVVATTWQLTIVATPVVLLAFGRRVPPSGLAFTLLIFAGIALVTLEQGHLAGLRETALGALPVLLAAFAYPAGNQLVWEARHGRLRVRHDDVSPEVVAGEKARGELLDHPMARVLLLTTGSMPFWLALVLVTRPPSPSAGQLAQTALVALLSGVIATRLFLTARHQARNAYELAAVDATQAGEVIFSLVGELALLGGAWPGLSGGAGVLLAVAGLCLYVVANSRPAPIARAAEGEVRQRASATLSTPADRR